jgi:hypothetical protein
MYGMFGGAEHALALVETEKISAVRFTEDFLLPWLTAMLTSLPRIAKDLDDGPQPGAAGSNLAMQAAAYSNLIDASLDQGIDPVLLRPMGDLLRRAVDAGHGDEDLAASVRLLRTPS